MIWLLLVLIALFGGMILAQRLTIVDLERENEILRKALVDSGPVVKGPDPREWGEQNWRLHRRSRRRKPKRRDW